MPKEPPSGSSGINVLALSPSLLCAYLINSQGSHVQVGDFNVGISRAVLRPGEIFTGVVLDVGYAPLTSWTHGGAILEVSLSLQHRVKLPDGATFVEIFERSRPTSCSMLLFLPTPPSCHPPGLSRDVERGCGSLGGPLASRAREGVRFKSAGNRSTCAPAGAPHATPRRMTSGFQS